MRVEHLIETKHDPPEEAPSLIEQNPFRPPQSNLERQPERSMRDLACFHLSPAERTKARRRGMLSSVFLACSLWGVVFVGMLVLRSSEGIPVPLAAALSGAAIGAGQWLYLIPWILTRPDSEADFGYGLTLGGALSTGVSMLSLCILPSLVARRF